MSAIKRLELNLMSAEIHLNAFAELVGHQYFGNKVTTQKLLKAIGELSAVMGPNRHAPKLPERMEDEVHLTNALMLILSIAADHGIQIGSVFKDIYEYDMQQGKPGMPDF